MGFSLRSIAADIGRTLFTPPAPVGDAAENIAAKLDSATRLPLEFAGAAGGLGEAFASRSGLATALNPFSLRLERPADAPDKRFDGMLVGAGGEAFAPGTPLAAVPAFEPAGGARNGETLIYVNGIRTDLAGQAGSLQSIADATGSRVVGVHNATEGIGVDLFQSFGDKLDVGRNPAVDTLADTVYDELRAGREVHLMAHSQGALITSRALQDVKNRLVLEDGMSPADAERALGAVKVETFGGAARRYPDGPQYVHYVNRNDGVPQAFGLRSWLNPLRHEGAGAVTHYFRDGKPLVSHGFEDFYLPERVPFDDARRGEFN